MTCDIDAPEFYTHSEPVARKEYRCVECSAPINKGERHFAYTGKWDGDISTGRQHLICMEACMLIRDEMQDNECIPFGGLKEWLFEYRIEMRDKAIASVRRLRALIARIKWRERTVRV